MTFDFDDETIVNGENAEDQAPTTLDSFQMDLTQVKGLAELPAGAYNVMIIKTAVKPPKTADKSPWIAVSATVTDGPNIGEPLNWACSLSPNALKIAWKQTMQALNLPIVIAPGHDFAKDAKDWVGHQVRIVIAYQVYDGSRRVQVKKISPYTGA